MGFPNLCQITTIVFITVSINLGTSVKINKLKVPEVIKHGASVILDCDFSLEKEDDDLVVKWYFAKNKSLVYQWIPGSSKKPQGLGVLRNRLNLDYKASVDTNTVHRALHILNVDPVLSGDYTCSVSTLQSEDIRTKSMLVFAPGRDLRLRQIAAAEGLMRVQCSADGVFPKPVMTLRSQEREIEPSEVSAKQKGNLYEVSTTATVPAGEDPVDFSCELKIPEANYSVKAETVLYPGFSGSPSGLPLNPLLTFTSCILWVCPLLIRRFLIDLC